MAREEYVRKWNYARSGKILTRSVKSLIRDLDYGRLNPRQCLMDGLTELSECIVNHDNIYTETNIETFETRFGEIMLYLSRNGFDIDPYVKLHESLFEKMRRKIREESFELNELDAEKRAEDDEDSVPGRYRFKTRQDRKTTINFQFKRVGGIFRILKKIYSECRDNLVDSEGEIIDPRFKEVWENFQQDLHYLEIQKQDVSKYRSSLEELFGDDKGDISKRDITRFFLSEQKIPDAAELVS